MNIRKRVTVLANESDSIPFFANREQARAMLDDGVAVVETINGAGFVITIRLSGKRASNTAKPGSFGSHLEQVAGHVIHQHNRTYERELR